METIALNKLFSGEKLPKRIILSVEIKDQSNMTKFKITDGSKEVIDLVVKTEKSQITKLIEVGNFIRIIFPQVDEKIRQVIINDKTRIYQTAVKSGNSKDITPACLLKFVQNLLT